jgi:hypothetical protein
LLAPAGAGASSHDLTPKTETSFGTVPKGSESAPIRFTLANSIGDSVSQSLVIDGNFRIAATTCAGETGVGETTCTIDVVFAPVYTGTLYGRLTARIGNNFSTGVPLVGVGASPIVPPKCGKKAGSAKKGKGKGCKGKRRGKGKRASSRIVSASPVAIDFGRVKPGQASSAQVLTLTTPRHPCADDPGTCPAVTLLPVIPPRITGEFELVGNSCGGLVVDHGFEGGACKLSLVFTPGGFGPSTGTFSRDSDINVALSGAGATPANCKRLKSKSKRKKCRKRK